MQVQTIVGNTPFRGKGLIANQFIPQGTLVWKKDDSKMIFFKNDQEIEDYYNQLNLEEQTEFLTHGYGWDGMYIKLLDDTRFFNHSKTERNVDNDPNDEWQYLASKDIQIGEELLDDYTTYSEIQWVVKKAQSLGIVDARSFAIKFEEENQKKVEQQLQQN